MNAFTAFFTAFFSSSSFLLFFFLNKNCNGLAFTSLSRFRSSGVLCNRFFYWSSFAIVILQFFSVPFCMVCCHIQVMEFRFRFVLSLMRELHLLNSRLFVCLFVFVLSWKGWVFLLAVYIVSFSITSLDFLLECILNLLRILLRGCLLTCSFVYFFAGLAILINQLPATDKNGFLQTIVLSP